MKPLYKLHNGHVKFGNELYKRVECGFKYESLTCDISADSLQEEITIQFLRNYVVYMRLVITRQMLREIEFKYIIMILESNFKNKVQSTLNTFTISILQAKHIFNEYSKLDGLTLQRTVDVCKLHIDMMYAQPGTKDSLKHCIDRVAADY